MERKNIKSECDFIEFENNRLNTNVENAEKDALSQ